MKEKELYKRSIIRLLIVSGLLVTFIALSIVGLVSNSNGAKTRYEALIAVDKAGGDVSAALDELRTYIYGHMNTEIGNENGIQPPIQLQGTYERLQQAEKNRVASANAALYATAQEECEKSQPAGFSGSNRLDCIEAYVDTNGVKERAIDDSFYKFDFAPPRWSADLAGISMLLAAILSVILLIDVALYFRVRHLVHMAT